MKSNHKSWISEKLTDNPQLKPLKLRRVKENIPKMLVPLRSGRDVLSVVAHTYCLSFDHEELSSEQEVSTVAEFFQAVRDWSDIGLGDEPADGVRLAYEVNNLFKELASLGFLVF